MTEAIGFVIVSWLLADLTAGVFHWWEDQYAVESWPIVGVLVAGPNALHHADQSAFLKGSYWERNWTTIVPAAIVGVPVSLFFLQELWLAFVFVSQANQVHAWSHRKSNRVVRMLQETGVLCSPEHHSRHHRDPFSVRYCVMSNWLNPVLDFVGFWTVLEIIGFYILGARPKHWLLQSARL